MSTLSPDKEAELLLLLSEIDDRLTEVLYRVNNAITDARTISLSPSVQMDAVKGSFQRLRLDLMEIRRDLERNGFSQILGERAGIVLIQTIAMVKFVNDGGINTLHDKMKKE